uniref:Chromosome 11 open reading frame 54 n=1 Tax=Salmo trutta TaxID=8032 RepID=A0A673YXI7_SALTR
MAFLFYFSKMMVQKINLFFLCIIFYQIYCWPILCSDTLLPSPPQNLFYLSTGLCGKSRITDVGGVPNLVPLVKMDKEYNMNTCLLEKNSDTFSDCDFRLLANLYACEGKPGMVNDGGLKKISELGCLEFSACPLNSNDDVNNWPKHFEVSGLDLRVEHTHCFSHNGEGGLPCDTTSDTVEYLGCFMPAEFVYRIDRPKDTHDVERD